MQSLILPGAFLSLPYIIYAVAQAVRGQFRVGKWGTLLAYVAVIVPVTTLALDTVSSNAQPLLTAVVMANAVIVLVISGVILIIDSRRAQRDLNHSFGALGLGVSSLLIIGMFITPVVLSQFSDSAAQADDVTVRGTRVAEATSTSVDTSAFVVSDSAVSPGATNLRTILETETELAFEDVLSQMDEGTSLAVLVEAGGGDLDAVTTALTETLEQAIAEGTVPQRLLDQFGSDAVGLAAQIINGDLPSQTVSRVLSGLLPSGEIEAPAPGTRRDRPDATGTDAASDRSVPRQEAEREAGAIPVAGSGAFNAEKNAQVDADTAEVVRVSTFDDAQDTASVNSGAISPISAPPSGDSAIEPVAAISPIEVEANTTMVINTCLVTVNYNLNLRAGPSTEDEWLLTIPYTSVIPTTGQNSDGWWLIGFEDQTGWVSGEYLTPSPACSTLPILP